MMKTEKEQIEATLVTDRHRIDGMVHLYQNSRLSDLLNMDMNKREFLPVTDAKIYDLATNELIQELPFLALNRNYIVMVYASASDSDELGAVLRKANSLFMSKKYDEAVMELRKAVKISPREPEAHFLMGLCFSKKGMLKDGKECFEEVLKIVPNTSIWATKSLSMLEQLKM